MIEKYFLEKSIKRFGTFRWKNRARMLVHCARAIRRNIEFLFKIYEINRRILERINIYTAMVLLFIIRNLFV